MFSLSFHRINKLAALWWEKGTRTNLRQTLNQRNHEITLCSILDICERTSSFHYKRRKIEFITDFNKPYSRELSPEYEDNWFSETSTLGKKELLNVKTWNKILFIGWIRHREISCPTLTDLGISVFESLCEYPHPEERAQTFGPYIEPVDCRTLNVSDLEYIALQSIYRPLPIYCFEHKVLTLRTILDTGAATNYISQQTIDVLLKQKKPRPEDLKYWNSGSLLIKLWTWRNSANAFFTIRKR